MKFLLFTIIPIFVLSQQRNRVLKNDLERYDLKGNVKVLQQFEYEPRYITDSIYELEFFDFIGPLNYQVFLNEKGFATKKIEFTMDKDSIIKKGEWFYDYDNQNRIAKEIYCLFFKYRKDTMTWKYDYSFQNITNIFFNNTDKSGVRKMYYNYRQDNNLEYLSTMNEDSTYITRELFSYDKYNRIIRKEIYEDKEYIQKVTFFSYTDSTSVKPYLKVWNDTKHSLPLVIIQIEYDDKGNEIAQYRLNKSEGRVRTIQYKYDDKGNWTEKKEMNKNGKVFRVYRREIEYYYETLTK